MQLSEVIGRSYRVRKRERKGERGEREGGGKWREGEGKRKHPTKHRRGAGTAVSRKRLEHQGLCAGRETGGGGSPHKATSPH